MARTFGDRADNGDRQAQLRKKVKFLERENQRLRRALNKQYQEVDQAGGPDEEESSKRKEQGFQVKESKVIVCDRCSSTNMQSFELNVCGKMKDVFTCVDCGKRKTVDK